MNTLNDNNLSNDFDEKEQKKETSIIVSIRELNNLNIIINDDNCRDNFVNEICEILQFNGIKFKFITGCENIDDDNSIVITLDQQYVAGYAMMIFAPLNNNRTGNSDALALSAKAAFKNNGFIIDGIACGQIGFKQNENGEVSERVPTKTESHLEKYTNNNFVTIALGTQDTNASTVAASIEEMLVRYYSYVNSNREKTDLIYCVEKKQNYDDIASILGTTSESLDFYNSTSDEKVLLTGETIINPIVEDIKEFDDQISVKLVR